MEYTELDQYPLPSGQLTSWTPVISTPTQWAPDPRPLTSAHHEHCTRAQTPTEHGSWIGSAFRIDRPYSASAMRTLITTWFARHEALRTTIVSENDTFVRKTVTATDAVAFPVTRAHTADEIRDFLTSQFESALSPLKWPHCIFATIEPDTATESFVCLFAADHSVMDAYSQVIAISELRSLYDAILDTPGVPDDKTYGSYVDFGIIEKQACDAITEQHPAVSAWDTFLTEHNNAFPTFTPISGMLNTSTAEPTRQASKSQWLLNPEEATAFNTACRAAGFSTQAGILAALAVAQSRLTGEGTLSSVMPVHTRVHESFAESMGWFVNIVPVTVQAAHDNDVLGALTSATAALAASKKLALAPFAKVAQILKTTQTPKFVVSYVDIRYLPEADQMPAISGRALRSNTYSNDEVYFWINRTPRGLNVSTRYPDTEEAHTLIEQFLTELTAVFAAASTTSIAA
ncbi:Aureobasidin A1 biosynthesis complex [Hoyosella rhizosphaerae]|uniref:Condensation domain-containing protein n=1 Tax=Hoyosella rhizosphaerae TaxID=1755582 RepID=A0A916U9E7_9ACTN|nr:condensation domain-containing protein [Hoyosella rhizosphaerae]MBN4926123.1 Aureobasidin A1 biosynthesis complex [Hoyosella rhizosphaerae]GGC65399.1 hypothetical protein GCM10011410_17340 [Hoyosella rhizosphaerae]